MANYDYVVSQGVIVPDTATLQAEVEAEFKAALGQDIITTPDTPEGLLIAAEVSARDAVVRNNAKLANQINPNMAGGTFLDAIWSLSGGQRDKSTKSTAICAVTGIPGAIVSTSVRFRSTTGEVWAVTSQVTIGGDGTALVNVQCTIFGPVGAAANTITEIVVGSLGLETVTNPGVAVLGTLGQTDLSARKERRQSLGLQGATLPAAIIANVYAVPNVTSLSFRENVTESPIVIEGVTLVPHSVYACVDGGTDQDVAFALLSRKSLGANWNGDVIVSSTDPSSGQAYLVKFARPEIISLLIRVTTAGAPPLIDPQVAVRQAILAYQNGEIENEDGFTVGGDVSPFELAGAINRLYPQIFVRKVEVAVSSGSPVFSTNDIPILISQKAFVTNSAITVITS